MAKGDEKQQVPPKGGFGGGLPTTGERPQKSIFGRPGSPEGTSERGSLWENLYKTTLGKTAGDYDAIMQQYRDIASAPPTAKVLPFTPITPKNIEYQDTPEMANALSMYKGLSETGGYSESDIQNLRARGVSPIRAAYANAARNLNRQRSLQGGYSPNYAAAATKMAREQSESLSGATTNVNAQLAQMIAEGKRAGMAGYAPLAQQRENILANIAAQNAAAANRAGEFNVQMPLQYGEFNRAGEQIDFGKQLEGVRGQQSLYGTTPALASTFGNQVLSALGQELQGEIAGSQMGSNLANIASSISGSADPNADFYAQRAAANRARSDAANAQLFRQQQNPRQYPRAITRMGWGYT